MKSYIKSLSKRQRRIIRMQNLKVLDFLRQNGIKNVLISRNKSNNFVIIDKEKNILTAYLLGTDGGGKIALLPVGTLSFKTFNAPHERIEISNLESVNRFRGTDVGTILLQAAENIAVKNGYNRLELNSQLNITKIKSHLSGQMAYNFGDGIEGMAYPEHFYDTRFEQAGKKYAGFFDKNLYFYYSNGFRVNVDGFSPLERRDSIPLYKTNLNEHCLQFGASKPYLFKKSDPRFKISMMHILNKDLCDSFRTTLSEVKTENSFVPYYCPAKENSINALSHFLSDNQAGFEKYQPIL